MIVMCFVQNNCMIDHRLHVLRVLAARGTVNGAAATLNYTPSAVSHQIRALSRELGVTLLTKEGRGVRLTPAARLLLARADELFARWEEIRAELAETGDRSIGTLRLCGFSTAAATLLPYVVSPLRAVLLRRPLPRRATVHHQPTHRRPSTTTVNAGLPPRR